MDESIISSEELTAAVIHALVRRLGDVGKTKIQKLMYFLQEAYRLPLGCNFFMHQYGPYSEEVETAIANLRLMGYISVDPDPGGYGFHVSSLSFEEPGWAAVEGNVEAEISDAIARLGSMEAWELELAATIHYFKSMGLDKSQVTSMVAQVKPRFQADFVDKMFDRLVSVDLIS